MVDEIRQAIASLPPHMDAMCRAIAAKGGPKVPPGMHTLQNNGYTVTEIMVLARLCQSSCCIQTEVCVMLLS